MSSIANPDDSDAQSLACPRCNSRDTKFCYYNNYSTAQPRHFCKNCKRYWTAGGSLRNVPVGGGLRKSKKSKLSKHGRDLLFASPGELLHPSKPVSPLPFASPSSSDAVVDEIFTTALVPPVLAYRPTFDFTVDNDFSGDFRPVSPLHSLYHMNLAHISDDHRCGSSLGGHYQLTDNKCNDRRHPQTCYGDVDHDQGSQDGKLSELSEGQISQGIVLSSTNKGYSTMESRREYIRSDIKGYAGVLTSVEEAKSPMKQRTLQCSVDDLRSLPHDGTARKSSLAEDEEESLGDVINIRYPYDWEQVFEVLIGGTPDFFQLPTF